MIINQEYKIWKKESPYCYDFMLLHSVDWPTFTFQWLPEFEVHDDSTSYYAIIASSSADIEQCQLQKIRVEFPNDNKGTATHTQLTATSRTRRRRSRWFKKLRIMGRSTARGTAPPTAASPPSPATGETSSSRR
jgi:hypothetical protein